MIAVKWGREPLEYERRIPDRMKFLGMGTLREGRDAGRKRANMEQKKAVEGYSGERLVIISERREEKKEQTKVGSPMTLWWDTPTLGSDR
jgi:hypothetical protein